ncbi:outer membrane protein [Kaistia granuli]|uniref:outer membrane protein n=1 Tax=Kaistia granuli TaxID=363259 RepID=UPI0003764220|nr:outer membrane protein [Kaistia granuli]
MIRQALGIAVATVLGTTAAHAADLTVVEETVVVAPAFSWTGFYAGVHAGYGWADLDTFYSENLGVGGRPDGFFGGGQVGYNYQLSNNVVLGIEADAAFADLKDDGKQGDSDFAFGTDAKISALGTVRGRAGYAIDRVLPYVTGGFAWANARTGVTVGGDAIPNFSFTDSKVFTGWTVGAGLEYAVTSNISAKLEYLYADLGSKDLYPRPFDVNVPVPADLSSLQTVKFGLNYKF